MRTPLFVPRTCRVSIAYLSNAECKGPSSAELDHGIHEEEGAHFGGKKGEGGGGGGSSRCWRM